MDERRVGKRQRRNKGFKMDRNRGENRWMVVQRENQIARREPRNKSLLEKRERLALFCY